MVHINWNIFKAKFNGREREIFENLSYMLFCNEYDIKIGIFRFKNQTGIETEPIAVDGMITGFQSKFYDTKLSDNKDDILGSLKKAKSKNPDIQKVLIYTNGEFSESSLKDKKKPDYLIQIEEEAAKINLLIEWRQPSHFEKQLSLPENDYLAQHYFSLQPGIVQFLEKLTAHAEHILHAIHTDARFSGRSIKIDRSGIVDQIEKNNTPIVILSGEGGSGKTAIIKELLACTVSPTYVFKAAEFHVQSIRAFFADYGLFGLSEFLSAHDEEKKKIIVIDSAEKLADISNQDPFKEFLSALLSNKWQVIFTTRNSYLDDLRFQMIEVYRLPFGLVQLDILSEEELRVLAQTNQFTLPSDQRLMNLIRNPFYLNEYLQHHNESSQQMQIGNFRQLLWNKKIQHSSVRTGNIHVEREQCFLTLATRRCETGHFFINGEGCTSEALTQLAADDVIQYESRQSGYFITHDIYEEWALEKVIQSQYQQRENLPDFFSRIGNSLPVRRAFRTWLSEKLAEKDTIVIDFVNKAFVSKDVEAFWKDELLVSVLLSDHADSFFELFENQLLTDSRVYLHKIIFLLRTACKEVDPFIQQFLLHGRKGDISAGVIYTQPKGRGWEAAILFLHKKLNAITQEDLTIIIPFLSDWLSKNDTGATAKAAGLTALHFYRLSETDSHSYPSQVEEGLLTVVLKATKELLRELADISEALLQESFSRRQPFDSLREMVLTKNYEALLFIILMPDYTMRFARQVWFYGHEPRHPFDSGGVGVEKYYNIRSHWHHEYFPASALQTPMYYLLIKHTQQTIDFILEIVNQAIKSYHTSGFDEHTREIDVVIGDKKTKQIISGGIWSIFRGNGSPVSPYLLQSIHMGLEKFLLVRLKANHVEEVKQHLRYLLEKTKSASITAVVASVVLAEYDKLFDIAKLLFENPEFFRFDNSRLLQESHVKSLYALGAMGDARKKQYNDERLATCEDPHRQKSLEHIALQYQYFKAEETSDEEAERRTKMIQGIIDRLYASIPEDKATTEEFQILRLLLTRIDRRKMNPEVTKVERGFQIAFNPTLEPDLKQMSQESVTKVDNLYKYTRVKLWATHHFDKSREQGAYPEFDNGPQPALQQTREVVERINQPDPTGQFELFNYGLPGLTCAAILKKYGDQLKATDLDFCKQGILTYAAAPLQHGYEYQIADGTEAAISAMPYLYKYFPNDATIFNSILLFVLFDTSPIGEYKRVCDYAIEALRDSLFAASPENFNRILSAFTRLKPSYDSFVKKNSKPYGITRAQIMEDFEKEIDGKIDEEELWSPLSNDLDFKELGIGSADTLFHLLPDNTNDPTHLHIAKQILEQYLPAILKETRYSEENEEGDYHINMRLTKKYARFLLLRKASDVAEWTATLTQSFHESDQMARLISDIVSVEDELHAYDSFWVIWEQLYPFVKAVAIKNRYHSLQELIYNYLLAWPYWKETAKSWRSLKQKDAQFFKRVSEEMGANPTVLYSICKLLNDIGSEFVGEGIFWIESILSKNPRLTDEDISPNTIYYLEVIIRKYVYLNRTKTKTEKHLKEKVLVILNFLVAKASVNAYLLREEIM
ncbi:MAG: hypothetical protein B7Y37_08940 [Sphingobacteriia bacterium 28-36-52]|nr:MAG: hypothetical protein B7Y37_08940 [Sphingobacteriia bacterium 28-36-52]